MNWKEIVRIIEEALGLELDERTIRNVAVSVICFLVALLTWCVGGWQFSAKVAMTAICAAFGVGIWYLP